MMNALSFFFGFLFLTSFVQLNAQEVSTKRSISFDDRLAIAKSKADNFKHQLYRFETALEDLDQESVNELAHGLVHLMQEECDQMSAKPGASSEQKNTLLKVVSEHDFLLENVDRKPFQDAVKAFKDFHALMEDDLKNLED
jgi:hypothetical protein